MEIGESHPNEGVTTFKVDTSDSPESWVIDVLDAVDEHHGLRPERATDVEVDVRGARPTTAVRDALRSLGLVERNRQGDSSLGVDGRSNSALEPAARMTVTLSANRSCLTRE